MASATRNIIDPATGAVITTLPDHGPADVDAAVARAKGARSNPVRGRA